VESPEAPVNAAGKAKKTVLLLNGFVTDLTVKSKKVVKILSPLLMNWLCN
jgi:hypothetical protein